MATELRETFYIGVIGNIIKPVAVVHSLEARDAVLRLMRLDGTQVYMQVLHEKGGKLNYTQHP